MGIDAVLLIRPKKPSLLRGVIDPERDSATVLDDGALLLSTFLRYGDVESDPDRGLSILRSYPGLIEAHDDPRGVLFIPDVAEPRGRSYDAVVDEIGNSGLWVPTRERTDAEREAFRKRPQPPHFSAESASALLERLPLTGSFEDLVAGVEAKLASLMESDPQNPLHAWALGALTQAKAVLENPEAYAGEESRTAFLVQRPSRRPLGDLSGSIGVNSCTELADGALVIHTMRGGSDAPEMIALALGEERREWASEHTDARGVPVFGASLLAEVSSAATYEEAVARLDGNVTFVVPHTIESMLDQQKERLRAYLAED